MVYNKLVPKKNRKKVEQMTCEELVEGCINTDWENLCPCEAYAFEKLNFPDSQETCRGNCVNCLLVAAGLEQIYTP